MHKIDDYKIKKISLKKKKIPHKQKQSAPK